MHFNVTLLLVRPSLWTSFYLANVRLASQVVPVDTLDFTAMAQGSVEGVMHLRFLVEILLASAIQCEDKETYIRKIMTELDHEAQVYQD